jgi:hypothetical protein
VIRRTIRRVWQEESNLTTNKQVWANKKGEVIKWGWNFILH